MAPALLTQDQHTAPDSHSLDPSAQANNTPPILRSINPAHDLARYQTFCSVESVYYHPDGKHTRAAVVLEVGFNLPSGLGERFIYALFPTRVRGARLDRFPDEDEAVNMSEYNTTDAHTLCPNIKGAGVGAFHGLLHLLPQKESHDIIRWQFVNNKSNYFPSRIKLLLLVEGSGSPSFPFNLEILPTLKVHVRTKSWHCWNTKFQPKDDDGWSFQIQRDYHSEKAKGLLREYQKPRAERNASQLVGMRAAVMSYLEEVS